MIWITFMECCLLSFFFLHCRKSHIMMQCIHQNYTWSSHEKHSIHINCTDIQKIGQYQNIQTCIYQACPARDITSKQSAKHDDALLAICAGNPSVPGEFPAQRPETQSFDVFFDHLHLNKQLSKQSWGLWFETLSRPLWPHCNVNIHLKPADQ